MKKFIVKAGMSLAAMSLISFSAQPLLNTQARVYAVQAAQAQTRLSIGASLTAEQVESTKTILGGANLQADQVMMIDGPTINKYLNDGSNAQTGVFSSALITPQAPGYGVQVQIVTPQYIQQVSQATYQNAAITAGAKDVLIRVASVVPVTGEGALAGVYALMEQAGAQVNTKDVEVAQKEIKVIKDLDDKAKEQNITVNMNQVFADIKIYVIEQTAEQKDPTAGLDEQVRHILESMGLTAEQIQTLFNSGEFTEAIKGFVEQFKETEAAKDTNTVEQLNKSISQDMGRPWAEILPELNETLTTSDILKLERHDYSDPNMYHPIIPAMFNKFYDYLEHDTAQTDLDRMPVYQLYSHTFIVEQLLPDLKPEEIQALNTLRSQAYYYLAQDEAGRQQEAEQLGNPYRTIKEEFQARNDQYHTLLNNMPEVLTAIQMIANATGLDPHAYDFEQMGTDNFYDYHVYRYTATMATQDTQGNYHIDEVTGAIHDQTTGDVLPMTMDFQAIYGVAVDNHYRPLLDILKPSDESRPSDAQPVEESDTTPEAQQAEEAEADGSHTTEEGQE